MDNKNAVKEIESYMEDAKYSITERPYKNIYKVIAIWIISLFIADLILNLLTNISIKYDLIITDWYFPLFNCSQLFLYLMTLVVYFVSIRKINLRYRERKFLNMWSFIPVIVIFSKLIPLFVQYINAEFLLNFYNVLTIHSITFLVGLFLIYFYRKSNIYIIEIILNAVFAFSNLILTVYMYNQGVTEMNFILKFSNIIYFIDTYNIYMLLLLLFMYLDYKHVQKFQ